MNFIPVFIYLFFHIYQHFKSACLENNKRVKTFSTRGLFI